MKHTVEYPLKPDGVGRSLLFIEDTLKTYRISQRDLLEALLISEETMLMMEEHAPEGTSITVSVSRHMGVPRIHLKAAGTPMALDEHVGTISLDQLGEETENTIRSVMLRSYSDSIRYRHSKNGNSLTIITGIPERILATHTVSGILLAVMTGFLLRLFCPEAVVEWIAVNLFSPVETLFISALMCITAPAVFVSITCSMFRFEGFSELGRRGKTVIAGYFLTSVLAALVGVGCFQLFLPGDVGIIALQADPSTPEDFSVLTVLTTLIPPNIIEPFISVNSIQLMVIALTIGGALAMSGKRVLHLKTLMEELDVLCGKVSSLIMRTVPVVVYCSTASVILNSRTETFVATAELVGTLLAGLTAMLLLYCLILFAAGRLNPIIFLKKYGPTMKNTFLKGSAVAAIPMTMRICRRRFGIPQNICSFSIPLGATINMDGSCVCLTIISLFFARVYGTALDMNGIVILLFLVLILSLGAPIAPGTLILCLVTVLSQMGIDTGVISLIIGINFILEMLIGMINTVGDVVTALIVAKQEGTLNLETYNRE